MTRPATDMPTVVLCGFMGTGKTAAGQLLAARRGVELIDTDALIESRAGKSIAAIFAEDGEAAFRKIESQVCASLEPAPGAVIATGGGIVLDPGNVERLSQIGTMILLEADADTILERVSGDATRPLLAGAGDPRDRIASLLRERAEAYHRISHRLDTANRSIAEVACDIETIASSGGGVIPLRVDTRPFPGQAPAPETSRLSRIVVGTGTAAQLGERLREVGLDGPAFVVVPTHLEQLVLGPLRESLRAAGIEHLIAGIDDGDENKTIAQVETILELLAELGARRDTPVITVGGGVTGDVGGFAASIYMRGVPFVQVPTTLLAQVDASIGGKTGVNIPQAKNIVGSVYQPHLVLIDTDFLETLPPRERANGMAEVIKTAMIDSPDLFEELTSATDLYDGAFLGRCVRECARVKARIVEKDPYERDLRRVLNLGHTAGHALEAAAGYGVLKHGEAVALGLLAALRIGVARGRTDADYLEHTRGVISRAGLPVEAPHVDRDALTGALGLDKKRRAGGLTFVLPIAPGRVEIVRDVGEDELIDAIE